MIGICIRSIDLTATEFGRIASLAEILGFSNVWITEEIARSGFSMLALASAYTERIKLGTAIVSIYARTPLTISMEAATLAEMSGSRFILGLGVGGLDFTTRGHGVDAEKPVKRMEEYINIIRRYLTGGRVSYEGHFYRIKDMRMWIKPTNPIPIYIAALNPLMLRLGGMAADGIILNMFSPRVSGYVWRNVEDGLIKSGRRREEVNVCSFVLTAFSASKDALEYLRRAVAFYCVAPTYRGMLENLGYGDLVNEVMELWYRGERDKVLSMIPNELVDEVSLIAEDGDAEKRLKEYQDSGITPILYPQPRKGKEKHDITGILKSVSEALKL